MSGFFQILGGGVVGVAAVLAAQYAPGLLAPPVAPETGAVSADTVWPAGTMVLSQTLGACPVGWAEGGAILLGVPAPLGSGATDAPATNGAILPQAGGIPAFLCVKEAP